jgi:hypothetical protein
MINNLSAPDWIINSLRIVHRVPRDEALNFLLSAGNAKDFERSLKFYGFMPEDQTGLDHADICVMAAILADSLSLYAEAVGHYARALSQAPNNEQLRKLVRRSRFGLFKTAVQAIRLNPRAEIEQYLMITGEIFGISPQSEAIVIGRFLDTLSNCRHLDRLCNILDNAELTGIREFVAIPSTIFGEADYKLSKLISENLLIYFDRAEDDIDVSVQQSGRPHLITIPIWGQRYIELADNILFRCLLARDNLPGLSQFGTVTIRITTLREFIEPIKSLKTIKLMSSYATIQVVPFPDFVHAIIDYFAGKPIGSLARRMESLCDFEGNIFAKKTGADRSWLTADAVIADGYLTQLKKILLRGFNLVGSGSLRARESDFLSKAGSEGYLADSSISLSPPWLFETAISHAHPLFGNCFAKRFNFAKIEQDASFILSKTDNGFAIHCFQLSVVGFAADILPEINSYDGTTCDVHFFADVLASNERNRLFPCPGETYELVAITLESSDSLVNFGDRDFNYHEICTQRVSALDSERSIQALSQIFEIGIEIELSDSLRSFVPPEAISDDELIADWRTIVEQRLGMLSMAKPAPDNSDK